MGGGVGGQVHRQCYPYNTLVTTSLPNVSSNATKLGSKGRLCGPWKTIRVHLQSRHLIQQALHWALKVYALLI